MDHRSRVGLSRVAALLAALALTGPVEAAEETVDLVHRKIDEVLNILRNPALRGEAKRKVRHEKILAVANTIFDWDQMAQRSLGPPWRDLDPSKRTRFVGLFRQVLADYYLDQMDNFAGNEKVRVEGSSGGGGRQVVKTVLMTESRERMPVNYYLEHGSSGWRVVDVSVEGVSLVNNYRSSFRQYLVNHSFDELLTHLRRVLGKQETGGGTG